jgi:uncharacterized protein
MADEATQAAANVLNALAQRFINAQWPELPDDWDVIMNAQPDTPEQARLEALSAQFAAARAQLQAELMRPEVVLLATRLRIENKYMSVMWLLFKANIPVELMPAAANRARAAILFSTAHALPRAFDAFFGAVKAGGIPKPLQ